MTCGAMGRSALRMEMSKYGRFRIASSTIAGSRDAGLGLPSRYLLKGSLLLVLSHLFEIWAVDCKNSPKWFWNDLIPQFFRR